MRISARALLQNLKGEVLLIKFKGAPFGVKDYWATPGGGVEKGESHEETLIREIHEETGIQKLELHSCVATRVFSAGHNKDGSPKFHYERYWYVKALQDSISIEGHTDIEKQVVVEVRWWNLDDLKATKDKVYPEFLMEHTDSVLTEKSVAVPFDFTDLEDLKV